MKNCLRLLLMRTKLMMVIKFIIRRCTLEIIFLLWSTTAFMFREVLSKSNVVVCNEIFLNDWKFSWARENFFEFLGKPLIESLGYNENSTVQINTVPKGLPKGGSGIPPDDAPKFTSDASKVECKGLGLKKAYVGRQNTFTVDTSKAGEQEKIKQNKSDLSEK